MSGKRPVVAETLKVRAVPEGGYDELLLDFLRLYRDAVQLVVNELWSLNARLSRRRLHEMFYDRLRVLGFRAHHAKQIYAYARSAVESAKANGGRKPVLRKLTARIDRYDYKLDMDNMTLTLKLHCNHEVKLKLLTSKERVEKYRGWSNYELAIKYDRESFWVSIYFKKTVKPVKPRTVMAVDLNFDNITLAVFTFNGRMIRLKRFETPLRKILTHRIWIERIQRRYPKSWRYVKGITRAVKKHGERIKNISWDYAHKLGEYIAELAYKHKSVIVLEDLSKLRENAGRSSRFNRKLSLWFYRRIQFCIEYEALERGLEVVKIDPKGTSSKCPKCGGRLAEYEHRIVRCGRCSFTGDRDVIATINLYKKFTLGRSRCGAPGVAPNAPKQMQTQEAMRGNPERGNDTKPYKLT